MLTRDLQPLLLHVLWCWRCVCILYSVIIRANYGFARIASCRSVWRTASLCFLRFISWWEISGIWPIFSFMCRPGCTLWRYLLVEVGPLGVSIGYWGDVGTWAYLIWHLQPLGEILMSIPKMWIHQHSRCLQDNHHDAKLFSPVALVIWWKAPRRWQKSLSGGEDGEFCWFLSFFFLSEKVQR